MPTAAVDDVLVYTGRHRALQCNDISLVLLHIFIWMFYTYTNHKARLKMEKEKPNQVGFFF